MRSVNTESVLTVVYPGKLVVKKYFPVNLAQKALEALIPAPVESIIPPSSESALT
jgi:hypothetical protein